MRELDPSVRLVLLDIEGTITPISFVHETLFPYARRALAPFLREHWDRPGVQRDVTAVAEQARQDRAEGLAAPQIPDPDQADPAQRRQAVLANLRWQMAHDRKTTGLKSLQGKIWRGGYQSGQLQGPVYDDVPPMLELLDRRDVPAYIYSSGSVQAQKLLLGHTDHGDLRPLLTGYHDTATGPKKIASSYATIAERAGVEPGAILFATDDLEEADAAAAAGLQTVILRRPGNPALAPHGHLTLESFEPWLNRLA